MDREILFRGKRVDNGEWIYGGYIPSLNGKRHYIGNMFECDEVNFETIGQYTGLTDKNGRRIFEGDILKHDSGTIHKVVFEQRNGSAYFGWVISEIETWHFDAKILHQLQVIGNVHNGGIEI